MRRISRTTFVRAAEMWGGRDFSGRERRRWLQIVRCSRKVKVGQAPTMHMINKRLLVGNIEDAARPPAQIGALLLVAEEQDITAPSWLAYAKMPFKEFGEPDPSTLCEAIDWIESHIAENRIMVCCRAGMGRSVSVVIAYLCCVEHLSYEEAVKLVLTRRPGGRLTSGPACAPSRFARWLAAPRDRAHRTRHGSPRDPRRTGR